VASVRIVAVALIIVGSIVPLFGPMLGRNFGLESAVIIGVGLVTWAVTTIRRRPNADGSASGGTYGDSTGASDFHGSHDGHGGGHGGDGGHGTDGGDGH
jgi:hypothetical protein